MEKVIGREREKELLQCLFDSPKAEFLAIYGRRRVGKTFLIRKFFQAKPCLYFQMTGSKDGTLNEHLYEFTRSLEKTFRQEEGSLKEPNTWMRAFEMLTKAIEKLPKNDKIVIFFDELPWLATKKARLLQAIDYYWNTKWVENANIKLIACGSAASWMIRKIIRNKGGLHNRITLKIRLEPFSLSETKRFLIYRGVQLNEKLILDLYMVMGGVPYYLDYIMKGLSATQNIDHICFTRDGILFDEFSNLFSSLFKNPEVYENVMRILAKHRNGVERQFLLDKLNLGSGGRINQRLEELEEAGFITKFLPYGHKKGAYYRILDEYVLFYFDWIEPVKNTIRKLDNTTGYWESKSLSPSYKSWSGYAFEAICYKHLFNIRQALNIGVGAAIGTWRYISGAKDEIKEGAQIDLLFDREDGVVTLCEIKYSEKPFQIDKTCAKNLLKKVEVFQKQTKTTKQIFLALISPNGLAPTMYSEELITKCVNLNHLFI